MVEPVTKLQILLAVEPPMLRDALRTLIQREPDTEIVDTEIVDEVLDPEICRELLAEAWSRGNGKSVRLIGVGVRFSNPESTEQLRLELQ